MEIRVFEMTTLHSGNLCDLILKVVYFDMLNICDKNIKIHVAGNYCCISIYIYRERYMIQYYVTDITFFLK